MKTLIILAVALVALRCGGDNVELVAVPTVVPGACHSTLGLPDARCTPGKTNPAVTQANIGSTICVSGWTSTIRPTSGYTTALKKKQFQQYDYTDKATASYEEDHLISLELGGDPQSALNLWPESWNGPTGAHAKDVVENELHRRVCAGTMSLAEAQQAIATDWIHAVP